MQKLVGYVYCECMTTHKHPTETKYPEHPNRIILPYQKLTENGILGQCQSIPHRGATIEELQYIHNKDYILAIKNFKSSINKRPSFLPRNCVTYICDSTYSSSSCAVGSTINLVDAIISKQVQSGFALVRPPGHHAEVSEASGFCFFNTIAIAAKHVQKLNKLKKILIFDWDIHHGNGIQRAFYSDSSVLYISLHRFDNGEYFPGLNSASCEAAGDDKGEGFNVNIGWNKDMMGNAEYKMAFDRVVMPIVRQFQPELILIAAGFDASAADPVGDYILTPEIFGYMTALLCDVQPNVALILEGGYNPKSIAACMTCCVHALQGKRNFPQDLGFLGEPCKRSQRTLSTVIEVQSKYWNL